MSTLTLDTPRLIEFFNKCHADNILDRSLMKVVG